MGLGMPKFISDGYSSFKQTCNQIKEGWTMVKMAYNMTKSLDFDKLKDVHNPEDFIKAVSSAEGFPQKYKDFMTTINPEILTKMTKMMLKSFKEGDSTSDETGRFFQPETVSRMAEAMSESVRMNRIAEDDRKDAGDFNEKSSSFQTPKEDEDQIRNTSENPSTITEDTTSTSQEAIDDEPVSYPSQAYRDAMNMEEKLKNSYQNTESTTQGKWNSERSSVEDDEPDYYPSQVYRDAMNVGKKTKNSYTNSESTRQSRPSGSPFGGESPHSSPVKKMLSDELKKRFGPNWKQRIPSFMFNPGSAPVPDLGLGLDKAGNEQMVKQMSKVMRDLV